MNKIPMTINGAKLLEAELHDLKTVQRPKVVDAIAEARAHGDLKENAEYHSAKELQSFIEGRIMEIEGKLSNAQIIDVKTLPNNGKVIFGSTVHLVDIDNEAKACYQIVGEDEADVKLGKISISSPMARAIISKQEGDEIQVQTPNGYTDYEIVKVEYI